VIKSADKYLLEDDLVQMVNAGFLPATVTEVSRAKLWAQVLHNLTVHPDLVFASGEQTAWVLRKNNPQLKKLLDEFIAPRAVGSSFGNTLVRRYLENTRWVVNSTSSQEMKKFEALSGLFKKYASQYDFDYLMMMAQGYQESMLEQSVRSPGGAVGIMQVMPEDATAAPINVPDVWTAEGNIHAGIKIIRTIEDKYLNDPKLDPLNKTLLAFASYNAGPNRIATLREQAPKEGLDPNQWFGNMELMVARNIGQVTVTYVGNVYKYYVAYKFALGAGNSRN
jgi:membrane-bound lytic murein transglycosylase MltF